MRDGEEIMPTFTASLEKSLHQALTYANEREHEYATLEHLLLALIDDQDAKSVMDACSVDIEALRKIVLDYVDHGVNGFLFNPGDAKHLADLLTDCVRCPKRIEDCSGHAKSPQNMTSHTAKMLQLYKGFQNHA